MLHAHPEDRDEQVRRHRLRHLRRVHRRERPRDDRDHRAAREGVVCHLRKAPYVVRCERCTNTAQGA